MFVRRDPSKTDDDTLVDIVGALHDLCYINMEESHQMHYRNGTMSEQSTPQHQVDGLPPFNGMELEGVSNTVLRAMWEQQRFEEQLRHASNHSSENPTTIVNNLQDQRGGRYRSMTRRQNLSDRQQQDVENKKYKKDDQHVCNSATSREFLQFDWLDSICAY